MRYRVLLIAAGLLAVSASVYGQASLTGKWQTDNVPAALEAQKNAPAAPAAGARGGGREEQRSTSAAGGGRGGGGGAPGGVHTRSYWTCRWMHRARSAGP